jgi:hypothetical protein
VKNFSREDAVLCIKSFNPAVDDGIRDSLVNFMVIANRLNAFTIESCHGHVDWIFSYPNISFEVRHSHQRKVSLWNLSQLYKRYKNNKKINVTLEKRVEDIIFFLTREIILFHQNDKTDPHLLFSVIRTKDFTFRLVAAFPDYSRGLRNAGMFEQLEQLMTEQRIVLKKLSESILEKVESISSLDRTSRCGCDVCRMKY